MSLKAKYIVKQPTVTALNTINEPYFYKNLGLRQLFNDGNTEILFEFQYKIPRDISYVWLLLKSTLNSVFEKGFSVEQFLYFDRIISGLITCLGLPITGNYFSGEIGFIKTIDRNPDDLVSWSAYADFLRENDDPRGEMLAMAFGNKSIKMNRNFPIPVGAKGRYCAVDISVMREIFQSILKS